MAIPNYTVDQIEDLVGILHKSNINFLSSFFYGSAGRVYSGGEIYSLKHRGKHRGMIVLFFSSPGCDNEITACMVRMVMFSMPLEKMPLLINDEVLGVIARWRLKLGR